VIEHEITTKLVWFTSFFELSGIHQDETLVMFLL